MANETKLEVYTLKIREKRKKDLLTLQNFTKDEDFLNFFNDYIKSFNNKLELDEKQKKSLKLDSKSLSLNTSKRTISGIVESGDYGYSGTGFNINTGDKSYDRQPEDTEIKPFYFLIYIPKDKKIGFIILQRLGVFGIHSVFKNHLNDFFKSKFDNLKLDIEQFLSKELARTFVSQGNIKDITLVQYNLPPDIASKLSMEGYSKEVKSFEFKIKAKSRLEINDKAARFMNNSNTSFFEVEELESLGFDKNSTVRVKSNFNGNTRTIDLSDTGQIRPYYDIDNDVDKNQNGHPTFVSIDEVAKNLIIELTGEQ